MQIEFDVRYTEKLNKLHNGLPFFPERKKTIKVEKLIANLYDKNEHVIHIRNLKRALNRGLVLKNVYRVIITNKKTLVKTLY